MCFVTLVGGHVMLKEAFTAQQQNIVKRFEDNGCKVANTSVSKDGSYDFAVFAMAEGKAIPRKLYEELGNCGAKFTAQPVHDKSILVRFTY